MSYLNRFIFLFLLCIILKCSQQGPSLVAILKLKSSPSGSILSFVAYEKNLNKFIYTLDIFHGVLSRHPFANSYDWSKNDQNLLTANKYGIYRYNLTTSSQVELFPVQKPYFCHNIRTSKDGKYLIFISSFNNRNPEIFRLDLKTNKILQITNNKVEDDMAEWSVDGSKISYLSNHKPNIMDRNGKNKLKLLDKLSDAPPTWSPGNNRIALTLLETKNNDVTGTAFTINKKGTIRVDKNKLTSTIYIISVDGTSLEEISEGHKPQWNYDGSMLMFQTRPKDFRQVYVYNLTTGIFTTILESPIDSTYNLSTPVWINNKNRIAFVAENELYVPNGICTINPDGTDYKRIHSF